MRDLDGASERRGVPLAENAKAHTVVVDLEIIQESALAIAQAAIQNAMDESGLKPSTLAERMGKKRSFVSRVLRGNHNMTIKTLALALGACGYRIKFDVQIALEEIADENV